ncbi:hypothetical protein [Neisseria sp.]|uniref:hypothetical protein n=1 Tax=Neisseria sp. TaxID=192066 RepID=UPI0026DC2760|nr:hypothetical protein [Neisseria sp.]MDO4906421.1 hypothetical protein [Neisseria sp.]
MLIGYGTALACLILQACFETRAAQYFDFKSGNGGYLVLAERWLERAQYAFWAGWPAR